jgi:type I restriction enzyme S subunit
MGQKTIHKAWKTVRLGDIAEITSGGTPSRSQPEYWNGSIPWVKTGEITGKLIQREDIEEFISEEGLKYSSAKIVPKGTILMAMYGQGQTRGRVAKLGLDATINQACAAILLNKEADVDFIFQQLLSSYDHIRNLSNDGGQKNLSSALIKSLKVFLPSLPEQQKIAEILSTWDEAIEKLERLVELKEKRFRWILSESINDKKLKCQEGRVKDIAKVITGKTPNTQDETNFGNEYPFVSPSDLRGDKHIYQTERKLSSSGARKVFIVPEGAVFFTGIGIIGKIGIATVESTTNQQIHSLIAKEGIDKEYLYYLMLSFAAKISLQAGAHVMPILSKTLLETQPIKFLINKLDQEKIAKTLSALDSELLITRNLKSTLKKQKQGLMQRLLTGKVRVKV